MRSPGQGGEALSRCPCERGEDTDWGGGVAGAPGSEAEAGDAATSPEPWAPEAGEKQEGPPWASEGT